MLVFLLYFSLCLHSDVTPASSMKTTDITSVYFRAPVCRIKGEEPEMKAFVHSTCRTTCGNKIINECVRLREREEERETGTYNHITRLEGLCSCFWGQRKFRIFLSARQGLLLEGEGGQYYLPQKSREQMTGVPVHPSMYPALTGQQHSKWDQ